MANQLRRFEPFGDIARLDPFLGMEEVLRDWGLRPAMHNFKAEPSIRMDVSERDDAYKVRAEIPGVKKEDIRIDVEGTRVSITAQSKQESEQGTGRNLRSECYYGQVSRVFTVDHDIDDDNVKAVYNDGILELDLPKRAGGARKQITVT